VFDRVRDTKIVMALQMTLRNVDASDLTAMKAEILDDIVTRFADMQFSELYVVSMMVDPRYRGKLLNPEAVTSTKDKLLEATRAVPSVPVAVRTDEPTSSEQARKRQRV
jgi:hypothetical protein